MQPMLPICGFNRSFSRSPRVRPGLTPSQITCILNALEEGLLQIREDELGIPMLELNAQLSQLVDVRVWS
jgi:hypothetical protein